MKNFTLNYEKYGHPKNNVTQYYNIDIMYFCLRKFVRNISQAKLREYYTVLAVNPKSSPQEIKKQFHKLAKEYHPDTGKQKN